LAVTIGGDLNSITYRRHIDMRADWRKAGDNLLTAIIIGPGGALYHSVVEPLPDGAAWDWAVWRPDEPPENSRHGKASDRAAAIAAAEDQLRDWTAGEWLSHAKADQRELAAPEDVRAIRSDHRLCDGPA
jgi:hypothetical protein